MHKVFIIGCFCLGLSTGFSTKGGCAKEGQFPYQALIIIGNVYCTGSIISYNTILSAANCFENPSPNDVMISLGSVKYEVDKIINHEDYFRNETSTTADIAIVKLKKDIIFNENVKKIDLEASEVGKEEVVGVEWRKMKFLSTRFILTYFTTKTISLEQCQREISNSVQIDNTHICTEKNKRDTCNGSSGGPLVYKGKLIGITSCKCHVSWYPRVYTKVSAYLDWINRHLEE